MLQSSRLKQLEYLLLEIVDFASLNIPAKHSCIFSFFNTSQEFNIKIPTVRDMVTRCCHAKISDFYMSIENLYNHDANLFKIKYYSYIPISYHEKFNTICNKFENIVFDSNKVNVGQIELIKEFEKLTNEGKKIYINNLKNNKFKD